MAVRSYVGTSVDDLGAADMAQLRREALLAAGGRAYGAEDLDALVGSITPAYFKKLPATYKVICYLDCQHSDDSEFLTGFAVVGTRTRRLTALFVHPDHWRRGVGRILLSAAREWTDLAESTLNAVPFFEACGMSRAGEVLCEAGGAKIRCVKMVWPAPAAGAAAAAAADEEKPGHKSLPASLPPTKRSRTDQDTKLVV